MLNQTSLKKSFQEIIKSETLVLVDFYAVWCGPCKMMSPILEELKNKVGNKVKILKVDVDKNQEVLTKYQIQGVPTLILFRNGNIVWRQSGVVPAKIISEIINQNT